VGDLDSTKSLAGAIRDPWFIVDADRNVRDYNEAFEALVRPASEAGAGPGAGPLGRKCYELLELSMCCDDCIALQAIQRGGPARRDDIPGRVAGAGADELLIQAGATPLTDLQELTAGALVVYRDDTEAGRDRDAPQEALDLEAAHRQELERALKERTRELLAAHEDASRLEEQLAAIRKGTVEPDP
jgi:hypothetical protein